MPEREVSLGFENRVVYQSEDGYKFSQDSVLLANLSNVYKTDRVLELGCGNGIVSVLTALKKKPRNITAIEIQPSEAALAKLNAEINGLNETIEIINADVRAIKSVIKAESFDKVLCNPPYFDKERYTKNNEFDSGNGSITDFDNSREISRHAKNGGLNDFISAARYALKYGGDLYIICKAARLADLMCLLKENSLEPKHAVLIYPKPSKEPDTIIIKARKGAGPSMTFQTFFVMEESGEYTAPFKKLYVI